MTPNVSSGSENKSFDGHTYFDQTFSNLPAEDTRIFTLVLFDSILYFGRRHSGLAPADHARSDATGLLVTVQDLGDASV